MITVMIRRLAYSIALFAAAFNAVPIVAGTPFAPGATTVVLVRHAEKTSEGLNPPLSEAGAARAVALRETLKDVPVSAIYVTPFIRTRDTAAPTATALGVEPVVLDASTPADEIADRILREETGKTVLVVGHSNTVPDIIAALGVDPAPSIAHDDYDDFFIVTVDGSGDAQLLHLHYGAPHHTAATP